MKEATAGDHLAVLIDGDNVSSKIIAGLMAEVVNYGTASVRRIYGDWTSPQMKGWRECLLEHSLVPIQQFAYTTGKNATDGAMIIDAMDLLYTGRFASFCLVSSDSDFTRLAARIREQGISVHGFGNRHNTHRAFVAACNSFVYFDALPVQADDKEDDAISPPPQANSAKPTATPSTEPYKPPSPSKPPPPTGPSSPTKTFHSYHPTTGPLPPQLRQSASITEPVRRPLDQAALDGLRKAISSSNLYDGDLPT